MKKVFDEVEEVDYFRAVISDSKLNAGSPWTTNQKEAQKIFDYVIKSSGTPIQGNFRLTKQKSVQRDKVFVKIYKENETIKVD